MPNLASTQSKQLRKITWSEVRKNCTSQSCWMVYLNKVYDVTEWGKSHPGGDMIFLGGGTDASILVNSYHPKGIDSAILDKYCIGQIESPSTSYYGDLEKDEFYNTLKQRVVKHFQDAKKSWKGESNSEMYKKTLLILVSYFIGLYMMWYGSYIGAVIVGVFSAQIGMCIMHDGSHGAFSKNNFFNWLTCWTMDMIGASSYVWEIQHVAGHHLHTNNHNTDSTDEETDLDVFTSYPFIRMHPSCERKWYHKYQHIYTPFLFALFTFSKVLYSDFVYFRDAAICHLSMKPRLSSEISWFRVLFMKVASLVYTFLMPVYFNGFCKGFLLYFVFHCVVGLILASLFQVTHLSEGCTFLTGGQKPKITQIQQEHQELLKKKHNIKQTKPYDPLSWAALQCQTSCNWALGSWFWTHFSGGLNHQIEHHLFPGICHVHYPEIQALVEKTCAEYGVPYITHPNFITALKALQNYLYKLGNPNTEK